MGTLFHSPACSEQPKGLQSNKQINITIQMAQGFSPKKIETATNAEREQPLPPEAREGRGEGCHCPSSCHISILYRGCRRAGLPVTPLAGRSVFTSPWVLRRSGWRCCWRCWWRHLHQGYGETTYKNMARTADKTNNQRSFRRKVSYPIVCSGLH